MFRLFVIHGNREQFFTVPEAKARVGSAPDNDLVLQAPGVSRHHALVSRCPGGVEFVDLGSKNGLYVEGRSVQRTILTPGLRIQVGKAWIGLEEVTSSEDAIALNLDSLRLTDSTTTMETDAGEGSLVPTEAALALAYHVEQAGVGFPLGRPDLLIRIQATLGADGVFVLEHRRGKVQVREAEGELLADELKVAGALIKEARTQLSSQVVAKRTGHLLLAGRDTWFLAARFSKRHLAQAGWRKDLLRFLAHRFLTPVQSLNSLKESEARRVLAITGGNKRETARILGISPNTLYKLLGGPD